jgi:hypothetical protein
MVGSLPVVVEKKENKSWIVQKEKGLKLHQCNNCLQ